jgi:hypothetical protein
MPPERSFNIQIPIGALRCFASDPSELTTSILQMNGGVSRCELWLGACVRNVKLKVAALRQTLSSVKPAKI